jgi:hypothetical protein
MYPALCAPHSSASLTHLRVWHQVACMSSLPKVAHVRHVIQRTSLGALHKGEHRVVVPQ